MTACQFKLYGTGNEKSGHRLSDKAIYVFFIFSYVSAYTFYEVYLAFCEMQGLLKQSNKSC